MLEFKYAECIAKIIVDETANEKVAGLRIEAMITLYGIAQKYAKEGFLPELVEAFFEKNLK